LFGVRHDFIAEMLFYFLSDHGSPANAISYKQFLKKLNIFWPKKPKIENPDETKMDGYMDKRTKEFLQQKEEAKR